MRARFVVLLLSALFFGACDRGNTPNGPDYDVRPAAKMAEPDTMAPAVLISDSTPAGDVRMDGNGRLYVGVKVLDAGGISLQYANPCTLKVSCADGSQAVSPRGLSPMSDASDTVWFWGYWDACPNNTTNGPQAASLTVSVVDLAGNAGTASRMLVQPVYVAPPDPQPEPELQPQAVLASYALAPESPAVSVNDAAEAETFSVESSAKAISNAVAGTCETCGSTGADLAVVVNRAVVRRMELNNYTLPGGATNSLVLAQWEMGDGAPVSKLTFVLKLDDETVIPGSRLTVGNLKLRRNGALLHPSEYQVQTRTGSFSGPALQVQVPESGSATEIIVFRLLGGDQFTEGDTYTLVADVENVHIGRPSDADRIITYIDLVSNAQWVLTRQRAGWEMRIALEGQCARRAEPWSEDCWRVVGQHPGATDEYDGELMEAESYPPRPPAGVQDFALLMKERGILDRFTRDIRGMESREMEFTLQFQPGGLPIPLTFTWDTSQLPADATGEVAFIFRGEDGAELVRQTYADIWDGEVSLPEDSYAMLTGMLMFLVNRND